MRVSILDIQSPLDMPAAVAVAESAGYHRYWVSEHHGPLQSASPTLATALAAGVSDRLRVGMGGVLLRAQSPLRVAADIALLRTFFPGRIDLGIAGASPGAGIAEAITGQPLADDATYRARIEELTRLVSAEPTVPCSAFADDEPPELWLCGTSAASATLAGELGLRYAFHAYLGSGRGRDGAAVGRAYRDAFRPRAGTGDSGPYYAIATYGAVDDGVSARDHWRHTDRGSEPMFAGDAGEAAAQIVALADRLGADEVFVDCFQNSGESRVTALGALAIALALPAR